jgi:selenocysteine-specific elongation factor
MMALQSKIDINDIRADKGGNPDIYRRALAAVVGVGSPSESESYIDEALSLDSQRRSSLTNLEGLRSKLSNLQITVIAPKKKANEDITDEVEQLKQWKLEIAKLSKEVNDLELKRDAAIASINILLEKCKFEDLESNDDVEVASTMQEENGNVGTQSLPSTKQSLSVSAKTFTPKGQLIPSEETAASESPPSLPILSQDEIKSISPERILNLNVGVLGHVDTGKTSLVKTLSSILSTAALDKSQQSRTRGITLDLGFSAFLLPLPEHMRTVGNSSSDDSNRNCKTNDSSIDNGTTTEHSAQHQHHDLLQITLVDCPGHASLIRTIIGGAQIIDMILLVVDATKGMQTQTAECLVIAEMTTRNLIVVLNKIDMFPENEREERVRMAEKKMRASLRGTKFENAQMVGISACIGGEKVAAVGGNTSAGGGGGGNVVSAAAKIASTSNIHGLLDLLQSQIRPPNRDTLSSPDRFHFAVDHCFPIKGQGTVLTGTVLSGSARPNDIVEFPTLSTQKKIKGLQMFRRKANIIQQGDRAGICVSNFDAKLMERGIIASPGTVKLIRGAIAVVRKVRFFKGALNSGSKFHVSVGHTTVMATVTFWGAREIAKQVRREDEKLEERNGSAALGKSSLGGSADLAGLPRLKFDWNQDFLHQENYIDTLPTSDRNELAMESESSRNGDSLPPLHWARLEFLTPVYCPMDSLVIGSRLDTEVNANACRLAFSGRLVEKYDAKSVSDHYQANDSYS